MRGIQAALLACSYLVGLVGWLWDWLEHLDALHLGPGPAAGHLLMILGALLATLFLIPRPGPLPRIWSYLWLMAAVGLFIFRPLIGYPALAGLAVYAALVWMRTRSLRLVLAGAGATLFFGGLFVDVAWHTAFQEAGDGERNMLLLPGHQLQLAGWLLGAAGALLVLFHRRLDSVSRIREAAVR